MQGSVYELAILLSLKDAASGGLNRVGDRLRATSRESRATLQTFQDLRSGMARDLSTAGVGLSSLALLKGGIREAGDFEAAMADLRMSIEEVSADGRINLQKLNAEFNRFESLGIRLGNKLPGTTQDFIEMFSTLKQGGLATETILDGTGEAVANLAIITKQIPKDLAEPFAQYAQQFQLTGAEAMKLTDVLAKIQFSTGLKPQELIEGSKFFQLRAGLPLGLKGLEGADLSGRLLATLRSFGLEGGIGGRELGGFMLSLNFNTKDKQKLIKELKDTKGIELEFFDKKGAFLGFDNVFTQMEKLRGLSTQEQMKFGEKLFDREGMAIASVFMKSGLEGWQKINQRIDKVPGQQDLINEKTATYNAKLESVKGTLTNLQATAFTPMLDRLKPLLDLTNQEVGSLQEWAKANPGITGTATTLFALSGITLTVTGGVRALTSAWRLWRIASSIGVSETGQLTFLRTLRTETAATATTMQTVSGKAGLYSRTLGRIPTAITTTIALVGVEFALMQIYELTQAVQDYHRAEKGEKKASELSVKSLNALQVDYAKRGEAVPADVYTQRAVTILESLNRKTNPDLLGMGDVVGVGAPQGELTQAFEPGAHFLRNLNSYLTLSPGNAYTNGTVSGVFNPERASQVFKERAPELAIPEVMSAFLRKLQEFQLPADRQGQPQLAAIQRQELAQAIKAAFPDSYLKATSGAGGGLNFQTLPGFNVDSQTGRLNLQALLGIDAQAQTLTKSLTELQQPVSVLPTDLSRTSDSATRAAANLDRLSVRLATFDFSDPMTRAVYGLPAQAPAPAAPYPNGPFKFPFTVPSRASGGMVQRGGLVEVHDREAIVPARVTERWQEESSSVQLQPGVAHAILSETRSRTPPSSSVNLSLNYSPRVEVNNSASSANIQQVLQQHSRELVDQVERALMDRMERYRERA